MRVTLSVIIPALNEEGNLAAAVATVLSAIGDRFADYELLIFNDGSRDRTGQVADELAAANPHIRVIHNPRNRGFGYNYERGIELAKLDYITMFPGDNEIPREGITVILDAIGSAEIVVPYISTPHIRTWSRRLLSATFIALVNAMFGLQLRYFNGPCALPRALLLSVPLRTHGFAYMATILVRLIRSGHSYVEVPMPLQARQRGRSKAFRPKNIASVLASLAGLFWEVQVTDRDRYRRVGSAVERRA